MSHHSNIPRKLRGALALTFLLLMQVVALGVGPAAAQVNTDCTFANEPLTITEVALSSDDAIVTPEGAVFAEPGDEIDYDVTVENRIPEACPQTQSTDNVRVKFWYAVDELFNDAGESHFIARGDTATFDGKFQVPPSSESPPEGEHRLRWIAGESGFEPLAGAERVIVVAVRPDVTPSSLAVPDGAETPRTQFQESTPVSMELTLENEGDYPFWNPNGGEAASHSPFDSPSDSDEAPDDASSNDGRCIADDDQTDQAGPSDRNAWEWGGLPCSYRTGAELPFNANFTARNELPDGTIGPIVEEDAVTISSDTARLESILPGDSKTYTVDLLDQHDRAGEFEIRLSAGHDAFGTLPASPEESEGNNNVTGQLYILGVDLAFDTEDADGDTTPQGRPIVLVGGSTSCLGTQATPCQAGTPIHITAHFRNQGSDRTNDEFPELRTQPPPFNATIYLNGEIATKVGGGDATVQWDEDIPKTTERNLPLFEDLRIQSLAEGGVHELQIRLDSDDRTNQADGNGFVAEETDLNQCPPPGAEQENYNWYCLTLLFEDDQAPNVTELLVGGESEDVVVTEGETANFTAFIDDNSLNASSVTARIIHPNGTELRNFTMEEVDDGEYRLEQRFVGEQAEEAESATTTIVPELGEYRFTVTAEDTFGNVAEAGEGLSFELKGYPSIIEIVNAEVNGNNVFAPDQAPEYRGTASEPENVFNITLKIEDTGHEDPYDTSNFLLDIYTDEGELNRSVQLGVYRVCDRTQTTGPIESTETGNGSACDPEDPQNTGWEISNVRPRYFVDNTVDDWSDVELGWVGRFNLTARVVDVNNRTNTSTKVVALTDQDGPPQVENGSLSADTLEPGDALVASADARDKLRVERVFLNLTKPDGTVAELNLTVDELEEAETANGTYTGTFTAGASGLIDQAGTYNASIVAVDFADKTQRVELGQINVIDQTDPTIERFRTIPGEAQEEGGPVVWEASIDDETAIKPPTLEIVLPNQGVVSRTMTFNDTREVWTYEMNASSAYHGTWTYTLLVADYAGNEATAQGEIEIKQNLPPQTVNWLPAVPDPETADKWWGPAQPTIQVDVVDFASGVQADSVEVTVNGEPVTFDLQAIQNGYRVTYEPSQPFDDGETVTVRVTAADNTEPEPLVIEPPRPYQFTVDAKAPSAGFEADPSLERGTQRVIGLATDLNVTATDDGSGPAELVVKAEHLAGSTVTAEETITFEAAEASLRLQDLEKAFQGHGNYRLLVTPVDAVGNEGNALQQLLLYDKNPPSIRPYAEPGQPREAVFANITDEATVERAWVVYTADGGPEEELELERVDGVWQGRIPTFPKDTRINFTVQAQDLFGNIGASPEDSFKAGDAVPTISLQAPAEGDVLSGKTTVSWTASDHEAPSSQLKVSLYYKQAGGDFKPIPDAQHLNNAGRYNLDTTLLPNGELVLQAIVFDGNNFGDDKVSVIVRNLGRIFNAPEIDGARTGEGTPALDPGQEAVFSIQIDGNARKVWANITDDQGQAYRSLELTEGNDGRWSTSFTAPTEAGTYQVSLAALTPEGPAETRNAYGFTVQSAGEGGSSFLPEWTLLSVLFAGALAVGLVGLTRRWKP